ncbi:Beta-lactamase-like protein 2 [Thelohanellus kitauei]|uniref:Beta-lactamase-like protein 2 n=1 Tax=Thelohanellus kitauei TaxID=669202 RepID=A0A0C2I979_THEKT|nr:Beta-lactamase-like protein 2 [Thelohanellus kitauei]KII69126.1 Beta-lactamase-like protein 2 [Thelohanellus kitauei]
MFFEIPTVSKLIQSIIRVLGLSQGPIILKGTNTYILGTGSNRTFVDTRDELSNNYITHVSNKMKEEKSTISQIFITHWHLDHTGGVEKIKSLVEKNIPVYKVPEPNIDKKNTGSNFYYFKW